MFLENIRIAIENLHKCNNAMLLEVSLSRCLNDGYFQNHCSLQSAEETLLTFASIQAEDGITYCSVLKVFNNQKDVYLARYFEYDAFLGYFDSRGSRILKETFDIVPYIPLHLKMLLLLVEDNCSSIQRKERVYVLSVQPIFFYCNEITSNNMSNNMFFK